MEKLGDKWFSGQEHFTWQNYDAFVSAAASVLRKLFFRNLCNITANHCEITRFEFKNVRAKQ